MTHPGTHSMTPLPTSSDAAPARSGDIAIEEELDAARRAGTAEAYELFMARHPDHVLAGVARAERERLRTPAGRARE